MNIFRSNARSTAQRRPCKPFIPALLLGLAASLPVVAQEETFNFDWAGISDRHMRITVNGGGVNVQGHDSDQVTIVVTETMADTEVDMTTVDGLRRLPNAGQNLVVRQEGGEIFLRAGTADEVSDVLVRMPRDARLTINSIMEGSIRVDDIHGELEIQATNGAVEVNGIRNAAAIHAHADDLTATIASTDLPGPLVFSSWAGDVDLSMPADLRANLRWRTNYGDVLTDLDVSNVETVMEREESEDGARLEGFTQGRLNGGGSEVSVTTFAGDIVLRRAE